MNKKRFLFKALSTLIASALMKNNLFIEQIITWITVATFLSVNVGLAAPLHKNTLRPPSAALQDISGIAKELQGRFIKIIHGVLIFDVDKTLSDRNVLFDPHMRDTLIKLLQQGMKIVITTGQAIKLQHGRVVEDILYEEKVDKDGNLYYPVKKDRRYRPIPASLLKNLIIYANEGTQRYTYNEKGEHVEDLEYRRGLFTRAKIEQAKKTKWSGLADEEILKRVLKRDKEVKKTVKGILKSVIKEICDCKDKDAKDKGANILKQKYEKEDIVKDINSEIEEIEKTEEEKRTQAQKESLRALQAMLKDILGKDDSLSDIIERLSEGPVIIDRETQLAFKYDFEGSEYTKKLKRELIARLIRKRLAEKGLGDLKVTVSGKTTIGVIQDLIDKETAVTDLLNKESLEASDAIYIGDAFAPGENDEPVTHIPGLNILSVNINPETTPEGVMWAGMGPEATRATLGWILQELAEKLEQISKKKTRQIESVIRAVRRKITVHTRGSYFFTRDVLSALGKEIDDELLRNLNRMLREGFHINIISRKPIESEENSFITTLDPEVRRNLVVYCRLRDGRLFQAYRFDKEGNYEAYGNPLKDKAEIVRERLKELDVEPEECIYVGDSFQTGGDKVVATEPVFGRRINIVNISAVRYAKSDNMVFTEEEGPKTTKTIVGWIINDYLPNMKKFPLQRQKLIVELVAKRLFAEDAIHIIEDASFEDAAERLRPFIDPQSRHYLANMLGERGVQPLRNFIDAVERGRRYQDETRKMNVLKRRVIESLRLITDRAYRDLLAVYNYDYEELNKAIDSLMAETDGKWSELIKAGTRGSDANPYRQSLFKAGEADVTSKPQVLLMVGGTGGNFLAGTLPFSEILKLKSEGLRIAIGVTPHDDGGASGKAKDVLYHFMGYIPSPGRTMNIYSGLVSSGKKKVLRWRFGDQEGLLRPNMLAILNRITTLAREIDITECSRNKKPMVIDLAGSFFKVIYRSNTYHFIDISTDKEVATVDMEQKAGPSNEFSLAGNRFKIFHTGGIASAERKALLVNSSINLDADWLFFCNAMLRLSQFMDENIMTKSRLSIKEGCVDNFVLIGNNIESGAYVITRSETELPDAQRDKARVQPGAYKKAMKRLSEALGVTNGYVVPSTFNKATLYAKLKKIALLGVRPDGKELLISPNKGPEDGLPEPLRTAGDEKVSFERSGKGKLIIRVEGKKGAKEKEAKFSENNLDKVYTKGKKISSSTVVLNLSRGEKLVVGQGEDRVTATPQKKDIKIEITEKDFKTGKTKTIEDHIDYGKSKKVFYPKKNKKLFPGTASFKIERKNRRLEAHITLDCRGKGTMVKIGNTEITFKQRLVIEQRNILEGLHLSSIENAGFINIDGVKPEPIDGVKPPGPNRDFLRLIKETEDAIVMGPGGLTISLMPILLVKENVEALIKRRKEGLPTLFIVNPYRDNETVDYTVNDVISFIERMTDKKFEDLFSHILINKPLDINLIRKELAILRADRERAPVREYARFDADISAKEAELKKAEEMLPLYNEMDIVLKRDPEKLTSPNPADSWELAQLFRGAIEATDKATDEKIMELGRRGVTVYRESVADIVETEIRQVGAAGVKKSPGYSSKGIARVIDEMLFGHIIDEILFGKTSLRDKRKTSLRDKRWKRLLEAHHNREEELIGMVEEYVRRTGATYIQAIDRLTEQVAGQESEVGELPEELPKLLITNANYTLIRGMDTKMDSKTAKNIAKYLKGGGKIIILSGIGLYQMMEWLIRPLGEVLGKKDKHLLQNILLAPYGGTKAFKFGEKGELHTEPLYDLTEKMIPEMMERWEKETTDAWSLLKEALGITGREAASFGILDGKRQVEMPIFERRSDADYLGESGSEKAVYFTFRMGRKGELWRKTHNLTPTQQRKMLALHGLPETAALDIFYKLTKQEEIQSFFKNTYGIDDFSDKGRTQMVQAMLNMCKTGRVGRYNLKILISKYLQYRYHEAGIDNLVSVSYQETINDINIHLRYTRKEMLGHLLSNSYIKDQFIGYDIIKNKGRDTLIAGRDSIELLDLVSESQVFIFDTVASTGYTEKMLAKKNVAFYNGPFGSGGFTQLLNKMLYAAKPSADVRSSSAGEHIRSFGKTGRKFFILGTGTIWFGRQWPTKNDSYAYPEFSEVIAYLDKVYKEMGNKDGVVMIDTAAAYGLSEEVIGEYLKTHYTQAKKAFIATKWGEEFDIKSGQSTIDHSKKGLINSVNRSLARLGKIELLYIHGATVDVLKDQEVISEMKRMRREHDAGIHYIGASISKEDVLETAVKEGLIWDFDAIQMPAILFLKRKDLVKEIYERGLAIVLNSPIRKPIRDGITPADTYAELLKHKEVSMILTGTRHHLGETVGYVKSASAGREEQVAKDIATKFLVGDTALMVLTESMAGIRGPMPNVAPEVYERFRGEGGVWEYLKAQNVGGNDAQERVLRMATEFAKFGRIGQSAAHNTSDDSKTKSSSAGTLNLDDIESLNAEALDTAIASAKGDLAKILVKSRFVGELFKVKAAGTIAIDDESLPANQRDVISDIYDENSEALKELERLTGCVIRLRSQLTKDEIKGQLIIISDKKKIPGYENERYLNIKNNIPKATDSYLPLVPLIGIAKVLLTSDDIEHIRNTLNKDDFYRDIFGHPVTKQQIQNFLDTGIFELPVPKFDYEKVEQLQRQALAALIAA